MAEIIHNPDDYPLYNDELRENNISVLSTSSFASFLAGAEKEQAMYAPEIAELEAQLKVLREQHCRIQQSIDNQRSLLSPIRRLPVEVLAQIFTWFISMSHWVEDMDDKYRKYPVLNDAPFILLSVSRYWNQLVMESRISPVFWSFVLLNLESIQHEGCRGERLEKFFVRSKTAPLVVRVIVRLDPAYSQDYTQVEVEVDKLLPRLLRHSSRFATLSLVADRDPIQGANTPNLSALTHLEFARLPGDPCDSPADFNWLVGENRPLSLHTLH